MAFLVAILTQEEEARLEAAGYSVEDPPLELICFDHPNANLKMVWVDCGLIELLRDGLEFAEKCMDPKTSWQKAAPGSH